MSWTELLKCDNAIVKIEAMLIDRFEELFPFKEEKNIVYFDLPDGYIASFFHFLPTKETDVGCLGIDYGEDDGDLFYPEDFSDFEMLFQALLEETMR